MSLYAMIISILILLPIYLLHIFLTNFVIGEVTDQHILLLIIIETIVLWRISDRYVEKFDLKDPETNIPSGITESEGYPWRPIVLLIVWIFVVLSFIQKMGPYQYLFFPCAGILLVLFLNSKLTESWKLAEHSCNCCHVYANGRREIEEIFGHRNEGKYKQPYCKKCRGAHCSPASGEPCKKKS